MSSSLIRFSLIMVFTLLPAISAVAEYIAPETIKVKTDNYLAERSVVKSTGPGLYKYKIRWQGIPVGSAQLKVSERDTEASPVISVEAKANTNKTIGIFYKLRHRSESVIQSSSLKPLHFESEQSENRRKKKIQIVFGQNGAIDSTYEKKGREPKKHTFKSENLTLDPIAAGFLAKSLPISFDKPRTFDVFNGKHRYLISFTFEKKEKVRVGKKYVDAYKLRPVVKKLTDSEGEKRIESVSLWVSADSERRLLKLKSKVLIGSISAVLSEYVPSKAKSMRVQQARL